MSPLSHRDRLPCQKCTVVKRGACDRQTDDRTALSLNAPYGRQGIITFSHYCDRQGGVLKQGLERRQVGLAESVVAG